MLWVNCGQGGKICANLSASALLQASQGCLARVSALSVSQGFGGGAGREKASCCVLSCQGRGEKSEVGCCAGSQEESVKGRSEKGDDADCAVSGKGHLREALLLHEEALRVNRLTNYVNVELMTRVMI